jgi:pimeloyl-ACP methyl ester carboxylesterase
MDDSRISALNPENVVPLIEGAGARTIVMVHGWPDTLRVWDGQVEALKDRFRCVRFTLPGFDSKLRSAYSVDALIDTLRQVVEQASPGAPVILLLHDWGCFFGYQFAVRHPGLVDRVIGVDIGDAGSRRNLEEWGASGMFLMLAYQVWLALAWRIGGRVGDAMARWLARVTGCPTDQHTIGANMGYPYALRWLGVAGGLRGVKVFEPHCPMLFAYGERKPYMFHSRPWAERLAARPGSRVVSFPTGHWIMVERSRELNDALRAWLG